MAAYLSHLAKRFFGAKSAVRPRLPSLFESAPGPSMLTEPERTVVRIVEQERVVPQPAPAATVAPATLIDPTPPARPTPIIAVERRTLPEMHETRTVEQEARKSIHRVRDALQPVDVPPEAPQPRTSSHGVVRPELRPIDVAEAVLPVRERPAQSNLHSESKPERPSSVELPLRLNPPLPDEPLIGAFRPLAGFAPVTAPPARLLAPLIGPQPEPRPSQSAATFADPAPQESPSVQVTIGRLIVEAVVPASAPAAMAAPRAPVPRLSLDDYLRQRRSQA